MLVTTFPMEVFIMPSDLLLKKLKHSLIFDLVITLTLGSLLHFVYAWSNENVIVSLIAPVNESVWEHLKLLFFPMTLMTAIFYPLFGSQYPNYLFLRLISIVVGLIIIPLLYYTYTFFTKGDLIFVDLLIFIVSVTVSVFLNYYLLKKGFLKDVDGTKIALILFYLLFLFFVVMTYAPPEWELFRNPLTGAYGI